MHTRQYNTIRFDGVCWESEFTTACYNGILEVHVINSGQQFFIMMYYYYHYTMSCVYRVCCHWAHLLSMNVLEVMWLWASLSLWIYINTVQVLLSMWRWSYSYMYLLLSLKVLMNILICIWVMFYFDVNCCHTISSFIHYGCWSHHSFLTIALSFLWCHYNLMIS